MLKVNKIPGINDNATPKELKAMMEELRLMDKPIDLRTNIPSDTDNSTQKAKSIGE